MPKVELLRPRSLNTHGIIFTRGVPRDDVSPDIAVELDEDPRFKVTGLTEADIEVAKSKPRSKVDMHNAILDAINQLDVDDEDSFTASGKPHHLAISKVLGYAITAEQRDAAMRVGTARGALETGEGGTEENAATKQAPAKGCVRILNGKQQDKKAALLAKLNKIGGEKPEEVSKEAGTEAPKPQDDDSTEGALEV